MCVFELRSCCKVKQKWLWAPQAALTMTGFITTTTTTTKGNPAAPDTLDLSNKPKRQPRLSKHRHDKLQTGTSLTHNKGEGVRAHIYLYICMRMARSLLNKFICLSVLAERKKKEKKKEELDVGGGGEGRPRCRRSCKTMRADSKSK